MAAAGGDGTINEVANGIAGSSAVLGVLPIGSVNVLAAELGIPRRLHAAWRVIVDGECRTIDLGRITYQSGGGRKSHYFIQLAGVGLDARAVQSVTPAQKRVWGPLSYVYAGLRAAGRDDPRVRVQVEGCDAVEGVCAIFGNGRFYGGPFAVLQHAALDDGLLDVCVFRKGGVWTLLKYIFGVLRGRHTKFAEVAYMKAPRATVTAAGEVPVEVDGEMLGLLPVELEIVPNSLRVMVPRTNLLASPGPVT